jgi:mRNA interferase RelE/StbE
VKTIVYAASAARAFEKLPVDVQERITAALLRYGTSSEGDVKRLSGMDALRLRIGDYRVVFQEDPNALRVLVLAKRANVYR